MAETLTYTGTQYYTGTISDETLLQWVEPRVKQRTLGIKNMGNHKLVTEILDSGGELVPYRAFVVPAGADESGARTAVEAWYNLLGSTGTLQAVQGSYDTGELSNIAFLDIQEPDEFLGDRAILELIFARYF